MTVETQVKSVTASGNGVATSFSFSPMVINSASELQVTHVVVATGVETVKTINVDYSVSVTTYPGTGSITYPLSGSALPAGQQLVMKRVLTLEQTTDLENQGGYFPDTLEQQLDKLVMIDLQQQEELDRTIKRKKGDTTLTDEELPNAVSATAGDVLALNSTKTALSYVTPNTSAYVTFPASSTDNAIVRFDGTTGKAVQNSGVTIDDNDIMVNNKQVRWTKGADIASASPLVLGTDGNFFDVTGTTGFSQITCTAGTLFMLQFDGALTITHGANIIMPHAANQTTQAGDRLIGFAEATNTVRVLSYIHATAAAARSSLGLVIGTDVQAYGPTLASLEGLSLVSGDIIYATAADTLARLAKGTDGQFLKLASGLPSWAASGVTNDMLLFQDQKASATAGDTYTASGWRTITVNTEVIDTGSIGSVAANQITLAAGSYEFVGLMSFQGNAAGFTSARLRLRDTTNTTTLAQGTNIGAITTGTNANTFTASITGSFTLAGSAVLELQIYPSSNTVAGLAVGSGDVEVYCSIFFRRYSS